MIYFLRAGKRVKIGTAVNPERRRALLQIGCPQALELLGIMHGGRSEEQELHALWGRFRTRGEWFTLAPDILEFIDANCWGSDAFLSALRGHNESAFIKTLRDALEG